MIHKCKFKYRKLFKKPVFLERSDIVAHREYYLRNIRHLRRNGYKVFYCDETWASPDQSRNNCWQILLNQTEIQDFKQKSWKNRVLQDINGWTGGFLVKGGNGRVIINHIGSEDGFLEGAQDVFVSKKDTKDYHNAMNGDHYHDWLQNKVLPVLPDKSIIVMDQAPYHRTRVPDTVMPRTYWLKQRIVDWLLDHHVPFPDHVTDLNDMTKASLLELSKKHPVKERFVVEDIVRNSGKDVRILWLPVAHCELNPIELIWAYVKGKISESNTTGGTKTVHGITLECLKLVTKDLWGNCLKAAIKFENKFWERDRLIEKNMCVPSNPNLVINLGMESSSESEESTDDESDSDMDQS
jgi:transposase